VDSPGLFEQLPGSLEQIIRDQNPWWRGEMIANLPIRQRWLFGAALRSLDQGLAPITVLRGPRQVGKTTLQNQIIDELLRRGVSPTRILRVQFDDLSELRKLSNPILQIARWYATTILQQSLNSALQGGQSAYFFFDEVQNQGDWAPQAKHLVDLNRGLRVLLTGSSALRIEAGRDSLAGRITTLEIGPLLLREVIEWRGGGSIEKMLENGPGPMKERAFWEGLSALGERERERREFGFQLFSERGAYPVAQANPGASWEEIASALNETVVRRAIQHDLRVGERGQRRDEQLLEEVFRISCRYIGQSPRPASYLQELQEAMNANIGVQRVSSYMKFLDGTMLLRMIQPLELRLKRSKGAPKLCLCDHALRAAWLQEVVPLTPDGLQHAPHLSDLAGRIAESIAGYFFRSIFGLNVAHFPERPKEPEVDYVLTIGETRIPIEIKYRRRIDHADTLGLRSFLEKTAYNASFGILVTLDDGVVVRDPRIIAMPLSTLLLAR
jgi:predicted AAA+ superfamily ATPase